MACLYLTTQGATVRRAGQNLIVEAEGRVVRTIEIHRLEALCLFGRIRLSVPAIELLLGNAVATAFLTLSGRLKGRLTPARPANVTLRLAQFQRFADPGARLTLARRFVSAKLLNGRATLRRFHYNHPDAGATETDETLAAMIRRAEAAGDLRSLRGIEGMGARAYFAGLKAMNRSDLPFDGRVSRPPDGPVNGLLSLGYVMLGNEIQHLLDALGLDPYLGFYHDPVDRRASLAVDLIEELRHPLIDRFCLAQVNRRVFGPADFNDQPGDGTRLTEEALKGYLRRYDQWMRRDGAGGRPSPRRILRRQVERLCAHLRDGRPYEPYLFRP